WAYGHPRQVTVDVLIADLTGTRAAITAEVAQGVHTFNKEQISKAIFATGWDGNVVLEATTGGQWTVVHPAVAAGPAPTSAIAPPGTGALVNINVATVDQLVELPMIGPSRAQAIVKFRNDHGRFATVDDLLNVPGIGTATLTAIKHLVIVN